MNANKIQTIKLKLKLKFKKHYFNNIKFFHEAQYGKRPLSEKAIITKAV